ncbi:MAG TPA: hypothetical protein VJO33_14650 [Gemmatimonadaceae bacterium]|nr:hypothetical protein [Gemmatimonadaceae bacterium]
MPPSQRTLQEFQTTLAPNEVLTRAKGFFAQRTPLYAAFLDKEGPTFCSFRGQGGEEIVIGVTASDGGTRVTGSTYLFDMQLARFFSTLPTVQS